MQHPRIVGFAIKALCNQIKRLMSNSAAKCNLEPLTGMQHGVIAYVFNRQDQEPVFQKDLESTFNIRRSTASGILQLMEKNELIRREPVPYDARLKRIILTEKAEQIHQHVAQEITAMENRITQGLTQEELDTFFQIIDKMSKNLG